MEEASIIVDESNEELKNKLKKKKKSKSEKKEKKKKSKKKDKKTQEEVEEKDVSMQEEIEETPDLDGNVVASAQDREESATPVTNEDQGGTTEDEDMGGGYEDPFHKNSGDERKIFLSRIPASFNEEIIARCMNEAFGEDSVDVVALSEVKKDDEGEQHFEDRRKDDKEKEHRGFAFVTMASVEKRDEAIERGTVKGKVKDTSKRKYTLYIRPLVREDEEGVENSNSRQGDNACFLWSKFRCPYGDDCKFEHIGEGGCLEKKDSSGDKRSTQKCFSFKTKGKCKLGDKCPYSHDFEPKKSECIPIKKEAKDKVCINWKTKGKCRKKDKCPYRHDEDVRQAFLDKKAKKESKKRGREDKVKQPLSIRVFGLNYDTTEEDVREYFKDCGKISEITFPTFEDSGRSKGYCGVLFVSPKATEKACELDGQELQGRWLSVQPGKMYLRQWEQREQERKGDYQESAPPAQETGEFGQKIKKRKKHGFKD
jgi:hypothetical protein